MATGDQSGAKPAEGIPVAKLLPVLSFVALFGYGVTTSWQEHWIKRPPPGVLATAEPLQRPLAESRTTTFEGYRIEAVAEYGITARVLRKESYSFDRESTLVPIDFALGWGRMSDTAVLAKLRITQRNRFYFWRCDKFPIPRKEIESHSANVHLIPANKGIARELKKVRTGDVVTLKGFLVDVSGEDGWKWNTSLSRADTGGGACELMLVNSVSVK